MQLGFEVAERSYAVTRQKSAEDAETKKMLWDIKA